MKALQEIGIDAPQDVQDWAFANATVMMRFGDVLEDPYTSSKAEAFLLRECVLELNSIFNELWDRQYGSALAARKEIQ